MGKKITISLLQMKIFPGKVEKNVEKALALVNRAAAEGTDIAILPEMFSSGFYYKDMEGVAEKSPEVILRIQTLCKENKITALFSVPEKEGSSIYNTAYLIGRNGRTKGKYRKVHLFGLFMEDRYFSRGDASAVMSIPSLKIGALICYDLRFPEISRKMAIEGAEMLVYCSQWPKERLSHWQALLRARAIENQLFVAATNGCGKSGKIQLAGHSMVVSPYGETVIEGGEDEGCYTIAIDKDEITQFRRMMPCLKDRHPKAY